MADAFEMSGGRLLALKTGRDTGAASGSTGPPAPSSNDAEPRRTAGAAGMRASLPDPSAELGRAAGLLSLDADITTMLYLQGFASNLTSAAQRLMPLGQTQAQRTLSRLAPLCQRLVSDTATATAADLHSNSFLSDIAAMTHETLQPRLFQS